MDLCSPARKAAGLLLTSFALWTAAAVAAPGDPLGPPATVSLQPGQTEPNDVIASSTGVRVFWTAYNPVAGYQTLFAGDGTRLSGDLAIPDTYNASPATAADGRHVVVQHRSDTGRTRLIARRYAADGSLAGPELEVTDPALVARPTEVGLPRVAMNAAGDFIVVWAQRKSIGAAGPTTCTTGFGRPRNCLGVYQTQILARRYTGAGTVAGEITTVASASYLTAMAADLGVEALGPEVDTPSVALADDGSYAVVWTQYSEATNLLRKRQVKLRHYPASGTAPLARTVEDSGAHAAPEVALDGLGNILVVYRKHPFGQRALASLWLRRYASSTSNALGAAVRVDGGTQLEQASLARIAVGTAGAFAVAWNAPDGVRLQRYAAGGFATGGNIAVSGAGSYHDYVRVAAHGGRLAVAWKQSPEPFSPGQVLVRFYEGP
ncbi:MAG TPA: hypothetical protein VGE22_08900 [Solimonas sp.]